MERGPVFVAGLERSGTSLMYALLATHPNIAMTRRTNLWTHFFGQYGDLARSENFERCFAMMQRYRRLVVLDPDWERLRREFLAGPATYERLFALLEAQFAQRHGKPRWGDKSLNTERYAEHIFAAYPGARVLHMIRDPRDRYASSKTRWQVRRGGVGAGTAEWLASARYATHAEQRFGDQYRVVRYETLVTSPERAVRDICGFIGEPYAPNMLSLAAVPKFRDHGNSSYGQAATNGISSSSIGRYREVLSERDVACIQLLAGREMARYGYEPDDVRMSVGGRVLLAGENVPVEVARLLAWRAREARRNRKGRPVPSYRLVEPAAA
jgi:sulfotransferase family protein